MATGDEANERADDGARARQLPLAGVRVLELADEIAGPYAGRLLRDLGAEVAKIEPPGGDPIRRRGPFPARAEGHPDAGGFFRYLNAGKPAQTLDLGTMAGRIALLDAAETADALIESLPLGTLDRLGVGVAALQARNPRLVVVSIAPFGLWGPRARWLGDDAIAFHASGYAYGFPSREVGDLTQPPLTAPSHAAAFMAGEMVAGALIHGLLVAQAAGRGSHLDVSLQEAVCAMNQSQHSTLEREGRFERVVSEATSNATVALLPCRDGWVVISPREEHQWARWLEVMGSPPWADDPRFANKASRQEHWSELYPLLTAWSQLHTKREIAEAAQARRVAAYPLGTATDLLASEHLAEHGFFVDEPHETLGPLRVPGVPYRLDLASEDVSRLLTLPSEPAHPRCHPFDKLRAGSERGEPADPNTPCHPERSRHAPGGAPPGDENGRPAGYFQDSDPGAESKDLTAASSVREILRLRSQARSAQGDIKSIGPQGSLPVTFDPVRPLRGVRIVDFSWVIAGPAATRLLAALGADVIKIESRTRPDLCHRDANWEELNPSKRSITLNLKDERARDLVRRLIADADVVVENFSTGVMERLGLGYAELRALNPRIVMASASGFGRTGPLRDLLAYGSLLQCFTGWAGLAAYPGQPPRSPGGIWTDPLTAALTTMLLLAAVYRQRRTGLGCSFDISMAEATIAGIPEPILTWDLRRELLEPRGNRHPIFAPRGCYPAAGQDRWLMLTVREDAQWPALCRVIGRPDLVADAVLATAEGRQAQHDALDAAIAAWTRRHDAWSAAEALQAAGVPATPTLTVADVLTDEHLRARGFVEEIDRLAGGTRTTLGFPWSIDGERPGRFRRAPRVGEDNDDVLTGLLGVPAEEYARLVAEQVVY